MPMSYPKKTTSNLAGTWGERTFLGNLPASWGYLKYDSDFGIDFMLELWTEEDPPKLITRDVAVQVKAHIAFPEIQGSKHQSDSKRELTRGWPRERIKVSTLRYLAKSNAFVFSIFKDADGMRSVYEAFYKLLPKGLGGWLSMPAACVLPLRPTISDALDRFGTQVYVNIPLHPLNFSGFLGSFVKGGLRNERRYPEDFDFRAGLSRASGIIGHIDWREVIQDSTVSDIFPTIYRVRMAPFLMNDAHEFIEHTAQEAVGRGVPDMADAWILFECLIAGLFTVKCGRDWLSDILQLHSPFFSLLALRVARVQQMALSPAMFAAYCDVGIMLPTQSPYPAGCAQNPFDCNYEDGGIIEFYSEACDYLSDIAETDCTLARETLSFILTKEGHYGLNGLFGVAVDRRNLAKIMPLVAKIITEDFSASWERSDHPATNMIRALNSIGISCTYFR